jgi:hypothetical protein
MEHNYNPLKRVFRALARVSEVKAYGLLPNHDSRVCGNAIYLRASRARKRQGALNTKQDTKDAESFDTHALLAASAWVIERIR